MTDPRCGTLAGYNAHAYHRHEPACQPCRTAKADWMRHYRTRLYVARGPLTVDAVGTRRRLQALMRIGWPSGDIAAEFGVTGSAVRSWMGSRRVYRTTAARVAALYERWWNLPGPSVRTAARAKRNGWVPPMAWDEDIDDPRAYPAVGHRLRQQQGTAWDEVAVERATRGYPTRLRPTERAEAVRRMSAAGLSAAQIAARLDTTKRSVTRMRGKAS